MDIQQVNSVLNKAILDLQNSEIEAISEAAIGGYQVPTPGQMGFGYKPKPPSAFGMKPQKGIVGGADDLEDRVEFTKAFLKELKKLKKDVSGIASMRQGYKGTGGQRDNVQIRIRLKGGDLDYPAFNVFVRPSEISVSEQQRNVRFSINTSGRTSGDVYKAFLGLVKNTLKEMGYKAPEKAKAKAKSKSKIKLTVAQVKKRLESAAWEQAPGMFYRRGRIREPYYIKDAAFERGHIVIAILAKGHLDPNYPVRKGAKKEYKAKVRPTRGHDFVESKYFSKLKDAVDWAKDTYTAERKRIGWIQ